ncbi:MAG: NUDIX domain-containing protein [Acidimicrobiales bacterium]|nr:NUDIX domain-containing protein [Acidimicrobiales bacterium]
MSTPPWDHGDDVPVRDAATVMILRDGAAGLEVFMLRRNLNSDFVGGAYVFPGGGVDDADRHADLDAVCQGRSDASASAQLGIERGGLAYWVAAVRECFEEAGLLLARPQGQVGGDVIRLDDPGVAERFDAHRSAVDRGERRLVDVCTDEGLQLAVDTIHYFSHWITPLGAPRRYDTRFFVARAPEAQVGLHDDREVIANLWIRPCDALARHHAGEFELIFPTIRSLEALDRFDTVDAALTAAAAVEVVPAILPRIVAEPAGGFRIALPGDPGYDDAELPDELPVGEPMNRLVGHGRLDPADLRSSTATDEGEPS